MKKIVLCIALASAMFGGAFEASAQFNIGKALNGISKGVKALTVSDAEMAAYAKPTQGLTNADGSVRVFSSHPETAERIKRLSQRAQKDGVTRTE